MHTYPCLRCARFRALLPLCLLLAGCHPEASFGTGGLPPSPPADLQAQVSPVNKALMTAASKGDLPGITAALAQGADVNFQYDPPDGHTPLYWAASSGNLAAMQSLLAHGAQVNTMGGSANVLLQAAAIGNHADMIEALLAQGAKIDTRPVPCAFLLKPVLEHDLVPLLEVMLAQGMDVNQLVPEEAAMGIPSPDQVGMQTSLQHEGRRALIEAADQHNAWSVRCLLEHGARVNDADPQGMTALMYAAKREDLKMARLLLEKGADPNASGGGHRMLWYAATGESAVVHPSEMVRLLVGRGASLPSPNDPELGILSPRSLRAAAAGNLARVRTLLDRGAKVDEGMVMREWEWSLRHEDRRMSTSPDLEATPLALAAANGHIAVVRLLLSHGAQVNETVQWPGATTRESPALRKAWEGGHSEVVQLLQEHGAVNDPAPDAVPQENGGHYGAG